MSKVSWYKSVDFKSIKAGILVLIGLSLLLYFAAYKPSTDSYDIGTFNRSTLGTATQIETNTTFSQGFDGLKEYSAGYIIHYTYDVDQKKYSGKYYIPNKSGNSSILRYIKNSIGKEMLDLKYNGSIPSESTLDIVLIREQID
jgi:hypothetical protein